VLVLAACAAPTGSPGASGGPAPSPTLPPGAIPLHPVTPTEPFSLLAWLFTPIFQAFFIVLVVLDRLTSNIAVAIIGLTLLIKVVLIPIFRRQTVSARRMQMLAPEVKELQRRYKGDPMKARAAQSEFYKERGVNPLAGCLPAVLQMFLLIPMYSVFNQGLQNYNPQAMLDIFGVRLIDLHCAAAPIIEAGRVMNPCLNPVAFGIDWSHPLLFLAVAGFGLSSLGLVAGLLTFLQSRMTLPAPGAATTDPNDPNIRVQRQMAILFPFIYVFLGGSWPAGLLLYIIVSTVFTIVQQYLIIGWGGMFPIFGWTPAFAKDHTPRFPVDLPPPVDPAKRPPKSALGGPAEKRAAAADKTIRHRERGRQSRRGRRR
jgi:YidC/Oxa1 family membrane protein insertase